MDLDSFRDLFKRLSEVGSTYTQADMEDALKLSYALQRFSLDSLKRLASDHRHRPAILVSMADGWGASVTKSVSLLYPGTHTRVTRRGKYRHEFMLERLLYRFVDEDGGAIVGHVFAEPKGLKDGKTAMHFFSAACAWPTLRSMGHEGVATSVYIHDGALHGPLSSTFQGRHALYYSSLDHGVRHAELENTDWVLTFRCMSHCCSSAVSWGLADVRSESAVDNVFIGTAGLRNSSSALHSKVDEFVARYVRFTKERSGSLDNRMTL